MYVIYFLKRIQFQRKCIILTSINLYTDRNNFERRSQRQKRIRIPCGHVLSGEYLIQNVTKWTLIRSSYSSHISRYLNFIEKSRPVFRNRIVGNELFFGTRPEVWTSTPRTIVKLYTFCETDLKIRYRILSGTRLGMVYVLYSVFGACVRDFG